MDIRDSRNDRMRSLCAIYWGAPDGSPEEVNALVKAERWTGISNLEMLNFFFMVINSEAFLMAVDGTSQQNAFQMF